MASKIVKAIIASLGSLISIPFMKEIIIFVLSMSPVLELRGGLLAASIFGMNPIISFIICLVGNIIPIPFILWLTTKLLDKFRKSEIKLLNKIAIWLDKKVSKHKGKIEKYGYLGLVFLVGIPLPGTGAWTGCMIAGVLEMDKKKSFIAAVIGLLLASAIMMVVSFGILSNIL